jgi:dTDP-4-dehydrorhamnose reductase
MATAPASDIVSSRRPLLIVGRQGQLATDLVEAGARLGTDLVALGRPELDLADPASIERAFAHHEPRAVINAGAYTAVDRAESEPDLAFAINRDGPAFLARLCRSAGVPLVHVSTDQVFDGGKPGGHKESDPARPLCTYGRSKLEGEQAVAEAQPDALIVRVSWVFGPSGNNFVTRLLNWARTRESVTIVSDQRGRPTYSPALAEALLGLAERMRHRLAREAGEVESRSDRVRAGADSPLTPTLSRKREREIRGILHLAGASVLTRYEQALAVIDASRARGGPVLRVEPILTRDFPTAAKRPLNAELDVSLAAERYGIRFRSFEEDLEATLERVIGPRRP